MTQQPAIIPADRWRDIRISNNTQSALCERRLEFCSCHTPKRNKQVDDGYRTGHADGWQECLIYLLKLGHIAAVEGERIVGGRP